MHILVLEDEKKINDMIALYASQEGHDVKSAYDAEEALRVFSNETVDLVITDLMLPGIQGEAFVDEIRAKSDVYIIVLSAKTALEHKLSLLKKGADDYMVKPFSIDELLLKLQNIAKRIDKETHFTYRIDGKELRVKEKTNRIYVDGEEAGLKNTEYRILRYLMKHAGQIMSRSQILDACLWESEAFDRIVDSYVKNIRRKLGMKSVIETVYGEGYRFSGDRHA